MNAHPRFLAGLVLFAAASVAAHAKIERTVEKTFAVQPTGLLQVSTSGGSIHVTVSKDDKATVVAHERIRADSDAEADEILSNLTLTIEQHGDTVVAQAEYRHDSFITWGGNQVTVSFDVSVPAKFAADAKTSGGDIQVTDRAGTLTLRTSGGNISMGAIDASVDARTSGGNVSLGSSTKDVVLRTSGGDISSGPVTGPADLSTSGGSIKILGSGASLHASTSGGDITATFTGQFTDDCVLSTSGGEVRATIDPNCRYRLDASTSGGSVKAHGLTITIDDGASGRSHLKGSVNGGGPLVKLRSSGGDIAIISDGTRRL